MRHHTFTLVAQIKSWLWVWLHFYSYVNKWPFEGRKEQKKKKKSFTLSVAMRNKQTKKYK